MSNEEELIFVKARYPKQLYNVSDSTLNRWRKEGRIQFTTNPSGRFLYGMPRCKVNKLNSATTVETQKICYCRVSSHKQKDDLNRQVKYLRDRYPDYDVITDIGSGISWKRKGLKTILERAMRGTLREVVVAHRDRLCRFSFELIQWILEENGVQLTVLDESVHTSEEELAQDLLSIIHVFSCKQMGKRRYKSKPKKTTGNTTN